MKHQFINLNKEKTLVVFHGTGGDEFSLINFVQSLSSKYNILSLRGRVNENGLNRFFKRRSLGVFDEDNLIEEANHILKTIKELSKVYQFDLDQVSALGYSNGANMIAGMLYLYPNFFKEAVMLHAMPPFKEMKPVESMHAKIFLSAGRYDEMVPLEQSEALKGMLVQNGADVTFFLGEQGHQVSNQEFSTLKNWFITELK